MRSCLFVFLTLVLSSCCQGQTLERRPDLQSAPSLDKQAPTIPLVLPAGTPIKIALVCDVRIRHSGQPIRGKTSEPIYAFDKLVAPVGTDVMGRIVAIDNVSKKARALAAMNADFSPIHRVHVEFDQLILRDGKQIRMSTAVSPDAGVLQFVTATEAPQSKIREAKENAKSKLGQARQDIQQQIKSAKLQITSPGKLHRLERLALSESPYRPQYLDGGTSFNADLQQELAFGSGPLGLEAATNIGTLPTSGVTIHAWLTTPLSSSNSRKNDEVEAVLSEPIIVDGQLYLPQGTELHGIVLQVRSARWFGRNGQLRIAFHRIVLPNGLVREVEATLEGLEVARGENLAIDSEGGARVKAPKSRYLSTGIALALAASSTMPDEDNGGAHSGGLSGGPTGGAANGAVGFKLVGTVLGVAAHSQIVTSALGAYGAAHSVYSHFLARGHDVVYPKDMSMVLAIGDPHSRGSAVASSQGN